MKIRVIEPIGVPFEELKAALPGHDCSYLDTRGWPDDRLIAGAGDAEILALTNRPLGAKVIEAMAGLRLIAVAFSGTDHVDKKAAERRGVTIKNAAGYARTAVAELTLGLMISLARRIPENNAAVRSGAGTNTGTELRGKTLGIVGHGAIGREVERLATAFGMQVLERSRSGGTELSGLFSRSDFVTLHVPLTDETRGMVDSGLLGLMKPSAFLVNCARGPVVKTSDLVAALEAKRIAGAALDVFDAEPPLPPGYPLLKFANVIATPHIGFNTREALETKGRMTINNILAFTGGG